MIKYIVFIFVLAQLLFSNEAFEIIIKLDENMRGENISMKLSMRVVSISYSQGTVTLSGKVSGANYTGK